MKNQRLREFAAHAVTRRMLELAPAGFLADGSCMVFKGAYTSRALYDSSLDRPYCDVDVLTTRGAGEKYVRASLAKGWETHRDNRLQRHHFAPWSSLDPASQGLNLVHPACSAATIDLQWRIGPGGIVAGGVRALLRDARPFEIEGVKVLVPSELDTVVLSALYAVRDFAVGGAEFLAGDLDRSVARWFRGRFDLVIAHARKRGLLRVLHAATAFGAAVLGGAMVLPDLLRALPPDPAAEHWHEWFPRWPAEGPGASALLERLLAAVAKPGARVEAFLLYAAFADTLTRRALIAAHLGQHVVASRMFGRFLRAPVATGGIRSRSE